VVAIDGAGAATPVLPVVVYVTVGTVNPKVTAKFVRRVARFAVAAGWARAAGFVITSRMAEAAWVRNIGSDFSSEFTYGGKRKGRVE
jgi:hypothetical protein